MKVHVGTIFNQGRVLCGLPEFKYSNTWNISDATCLRCLHSYISRDLSEKFKIPAIKQLEKVTYNKEFEDILE